MLVVQIEHSETFEHGNPKPGGLSDPRLGTIDRKVKCETCSAIMAECPGHFGHLELAKPMYHIGFMKTIISILRCICFNCSCILADEDDPRFKQALKVKNPKHRLNFFLDCCKNKTKCEGGHVINEDQGHDGDEEVKKRHHGGCVAQPPKISIDGMKIIVEYKSPRKKAHDQEQLMPEPLERKQQLSGKRVLNVLKRITDEECKMLGLNPKYALPNWMILQVLPVLPHPVRPSVMMDTTSRSENTSIQNSMDAKPRSRNQGRGGRGGYLMGRGFVRLSYCSILQDIGASKGSNARDNGTYKIPNKVDNSAIPPFSNENVQAKACASRKR